MIAAIYARKSTDQSGVSDDAKSVARQILQATRYAQERGWTVDERYVFTDDGISGAEFAKRPAFVRLMACLRPRAPFDVLVMSETSRLGREQVETAYALKQISTAGVQVHLYLEGRQAKLDTPMDKMMASLQAMADEMERERARQRTKDALERKFRAGHAVGGRVFGYDNVEVVGRDGKRSHVVRRVNDAEAAVVRRVFELASRGKGVRGIAKVLNEERALAPRSQQGRPRGWAPSSVRAVLYRSTYRGVVTWNATAKRDSWGAIKSSDRPASEHIAIEAPELRVVDEAIWTAAHRRLSVARESYLRGSNGRLFGRPETGVESKYLLPGLGRCALCGAGLVAVSGTSGKTRRQRYYTCGGYHGRGASVCSNNLRGHMEVVDAAVLRAFERQLMAPDVIAEVIDVALARLSPARDGLCSDADALKKAATEVEREIDNLTRAITAGGHLASLVKALAAKEDEREQIRQRLVGTGQAARRAGAAPGRLRVELERRLGDWRGLLQRQTPQARQILKKLIAGPIRFTPMQDDDGTRYFRFEAEGTLAKMLGEESLQESWRPHREARKVARSR